MILEVKMQYVKNIHENSYGSMDLCLRDSSIRV